MDKKLKEQQVIINKTPELNYRVDENLNVIIDSRARKKLEKEEVLHRLEEQKRIVWIENMAESLEKELEKIEIELEATGHEHDAQKSMIKLRMLTQPVIAKGLMIIDSLQLNTVIHWDSVESEILRSLENEPDADLEVFQENKSIIKEQADKK